MLTDPLARLADSKPRLPCERGRCCHLRPENDWNSTGRYNLDSKPARQFHGSDSGKAEHALLSLLYYTC